MTKLRLMIVLVTCAAFTFLTVAATGNGSSGLLQIQWNQKGLASIIFDGRNYLSFGDFNLSRVNIVDAQGKPLPAPLQSVVAVDPKADTMTSVFPWSSIQTKVTAKQNILSVMVSIKNTSGGFIDGLSFEPMRLQFDQKPEQYDGSIPILADNISKPAVLVMSTSDESVILADDDPAKPLLIGFPWAINKPASTEFPIRVAIGHEPMYPDQTPFIRRPIPPGGSDTYQFSLTFGDPRDSTLALNAYRRLTSLYPSTLHWTDRRPIGAIMLATSNAGFPGNPRGWFLDRSLDISSRRGQLKFRSELMRWADTSISILHQMNAQGAITWDIEGEQYPHPSTYVGDPRLIDALDPEMSSCVDEYFKKFRDAGLRVGVTIRPQQFVRSADGLSATQQAVSSPTQLLDDKIQYARKRWGVSLIYVDSNGDPNYPLDTSVLRAVSIHNPDVLLIPEHSSLLYYAFSAPYGELRRGVTSSPSLVRQLYPEAFRVINTSDGPIDQNVSVLREAVAHGDILMFRAWFQDSANEMVHAISTQPRLAEYR